jgi:gamma-glutamylcyclotransferase (GGCT)/AIG2-like uncharacterized protein YtfP
LDHEGTVHGEVLNFWQDRCPDILELLDSVNNVPELGTREVVEVTYPNGKTENAWIYIFKGHIG